MWPQLGREATPVPVQQQQQRSQGYCQEGGAQSKQAQTLTDGAKACHRCPITLEEGSLWANLCQQHSRQRRGPGLLVPSAWKRRTRAAESSQAHPGQAAHAGNSNVISGNGTRSWNRVAVVGPVHSWLLREPEVLSSHATKRAPGHIQWPESQASCPGITNRKTRPVV